MLFAILVFLSAFLIEGIGTYVSVVGLSALFAANPVIIVLAVALDIGKVVSVSFLYKHWRRVNFLMKSYMTIAAIVLMLITSAGCFGYLSGEFQKAISNTNTQAVQLAALTDEQGRLQKRKEAIDKQIAQLPENMVAGRTRLIKQFAPEVNRINDRLVEIDKELPKLKIESIKKNVEVGPIIYVAEAFNTTPEHAVKWVILTIIFVFDPLAIALLLAGNYLIELRSSEKKDPFKFDDLAEDPLEKKLEAFVPEKHGGEVGFTPPQPMPPAPIPEGWVREDYVDSFDHGGKGSKVETLPDGNDTETVQDIIEEQTAPQEPLFTIMEPSPGIVKPATTNRPDERVLEPIGQVLNHNGRDVITLDQVRPPAPLRSSLDNIDGRRSDVELEGEQTHSSTIGTYQDKA
jgi:cell division protein FtsB